MAQHIKYLSQRKNPRKNEVRLKFKLYSIEFSQTQKRLRKPTKVTNGIQCYVQVIINMFILLMKLIKYGLL